MAKEPSTRDYELARQQIANSRHRQAARSEAFVETLRIAKILDEAQRADTFQFQGSATGRFASASPRKPSKGVSGA